MNNCSICAANLMILDLQLPVGEREIKTAYRDMAKVWHPDRFQSDVRLCAKAEEHFKRIQNAYQELSKHLALHSRSTSTNQEKQSSRPNRATGNSPINPQRVLDILTRHSDDKRFLVEPEIPEHFIQRVTKFYSDHSNRFLGIVDLSRCWNGEAFFAFTPQRMAYKDGSSFVHSIEYETLKVKLLFDIFAEHGLAMEISVNRLLFQMLSELKGEFAV